MDMEYSASAMVLPCLFPCLNVRKVTTGESNTWFFMNSWLGCLIVLLQVVFVMSLRN